jgi:hypothetical protein
MTTYSDLIEYFEGFVNVIPDLQVVRVGDDEAIIEFQNSQIKYPVLWVETPSVRFTDPGGVPAKRFRFALVTLWNEPKKTTQEANQKLSVALELMEVVYNKILNDAENSDCFVLVLNDSDAEPVRRWSADNCFGWRMELDIEIERCECP